MSAGAVDKEAYVARIAQVFIDLAAAAHPVHQVIELDVSRACRFMHLAIILTILSFAGTMFALVARHSLLGVPLFVVLASVAVRLLVAVLARPSPVCHQRLPVVFRARVAHG